MTSNRGSIPKPATHLHESLDLMEHNRDVGERHEGLGARERKRSQAGSISADKNESFGHFEIKKKEWI